MDALFGPLALGCLVALASALGVVFARRPIYAAISLLIHSLSLAVLFAIMSAAMVAVGQVLIYSGAIVVLFLFVVTLLPTGGRELGAMGQRAGAALIAGAALVVALGAVLAQGGLAPVGNGSFDLSVAAVGHALFGPLLVAFELTAPLLLVAIVGGVVIWRRHEPRPRVTPPTTAMTEHREVVLHR